MAPTGAVQGPSTPATSTGYGIRGLAARPPAAGTMARQMGGHPVNKSATSAFALTGRPAAKADPARTGDDERHCAAITTTLERQVAMTRATQQLVILASA